MKGGGGGGVKIDPPQKKLHSKSPALLGWRNKIIELKEIVKDLGSNCFIVSETKLDESFLSQKLEMTN